MRRQILVVLFFMFLVIGLSAGEEGALTVGTSVGVKPFIFKDEQGKIVGLAIDLAKAIVKSLDLKLKIKNFTEDSLIPALLTSMVDVVIGTYYPDEESLQVVDISLPYYDHSFVLVERSEEPYTLEGRFGVVTPVDYPLTEKAKEGLKDFSWEEFKDVERAFNDLQGKKIQGIFLPKPYLESFLSTHTEIKAIEDVFVGERYVVIVRKGDAKLLETVNKLLEDKEFIQSIYEKWELQSPQPTTETTTQ